MSGMHTHKMRDLSLNIELCPTVVNKRVKRKITTKKVFLELKLTVFILNKTTKWFFFVPLVVVFMLTETALMERYP